MNTVKNYVSISPIKVGYNDKTNATRLYVALQNDNLHSQCTLMYVLRDELGASLKIGNVKMTGADYTNWSGDNTTPYTYVASKINVTIVA